MAEEKDPRRRVNPAVRHDRPHRVEPREERPEREERVKGTQDAELDPRDQGGIAE
jgi:hypothetical protein